MKAMGIFFVAPHRVELREFEIDEPESNQVQVELSVTGICAYDLALFNGFVPKGHRYPFLHGHEGVGIVRKVGATISSLHVGDKVAVMGNASRLFGHVANVPENLAARIPDDAAPAQVWLAEPVSTVVNAFEWCKLLPGDRVAVVGTGFMGLLFVQALKYSLSVQVIAVDVNGRRLDLAAKFGATEIINPATETGRERLAQCKEDPVDVVIESGGAQGTIDLATELVRTAGRLIIFGSHRGEGPRHVDLYEWHHKGLEVYNTSPKLTTDYTRVFRRTVRLMEKGIFELEPLITHTAAPEQAQELLTLASKHRDDYLKGAIMW